MKKIALPKIDIITFFKSLNLHVHLRKLNLTTLLGVLAYLHVLVIFPLIFSKNKPFLQFHAKQGLLLLAFMTLGLFALYIPILSWIVIVFYAIFLIAGIINVFLGRERHLPIIGVLAEKV